MARSDDEDPDDEFFKRVYGEGYRPQTREEKEEEERARERERERERDLRKRGRERERDRVGDEDEGAVPRDFRSKYSRAWDDRARAVERHYSRRREEDLTCRSCGEKGHPTQVRIGHQRPRSPLRLSSQFSCLAMSPFVHSRWAFPAAS